MLQNTLKSLRLLIGLAMMLAGSFVLVKGGISSPPFHVNWGCFGLGLVLLIPGAVLFRPSLFLTRVSGRR